MIDYWTFVVVVVMRQGCQMIGVGGVEEGMICFLFVRLLGFGVFGNIAK